MRVDGRGGRIEGVAMGTDNQMGMQAPQVPGPEMGRYIMDKVLKGTMAENKKLLQTEIRISIY